MGDLMDIRHVRREVRTALELAVIELAPTELVDRLATAAGLLETLVELPASCAPAIAIEARTRALSRSAIDLWRKWQSKHAARKPRG